MKPENLDLTLIKLENALSTYSKDNSIDKEIEVLFLGSQAILFSHRNVSNKAIVTSYEIDIIILMKDGDPDMLSKFSDQIEFAYGYGSNLHDEEAFYIDNMTDPFNENSNIKNFPKNWRSRVKSKIGEDNSKIKFIFLDIHDISILKLIANRDKDLEYVRTLIQGSVLDKKLLFNSLHESEEFITESQLISIKNKINAFYELPQMNIFNKKQHKNS